MLVVQTWAGALMRNKISGKEAHCALNHICDNFSKPPSIADFLEKAKSYRNKPLAHRPFQAVEIKELPTKEREGKMKTADYFLSKIYKELNQSE